ncbi:MAG: hypothetical protein K0R44_3716 [Thermomicrobiales bacterium]|jgi:hypothetical protein|nr:hypothetical protein [Thermomicrobiales bacterium]
MTHTTATDDPDRPRRVRRTHPRATSRRRADGPLEMIAAEAVHSTLIDHPGQRRPTAAAESQQAGRSTQPPGQVPRSPDRIVKEERCLREP